MKIMFVNITPLMIFLLFSFFAVSVAAKSPVKFDHIWLTVSRDAPERKALEDAGFRISPEVNHHDGQGTASITVDFVNSYIELIWADESVKVAPGGEKAVEKFRQRMNWQTSGWCPIGIGLHRTSATNDALPLPVWSITPAWLKDGTAIEILTPREDTKSPSFFVIPQYLAVDEAARSKSNNIRHPIGVKKITKIRLLSPETYKPIEALNYLQKEKILTLDKGEKWLAELTFDNWKKRKTKDLRPTLPLLIRY